MGNDCTKVLSEYEIEATHYSQVGPWTLHAAERRTNVEEKFTVFTGKLRNYGQLSKEFQRAIERLKTLRHPSILKYLDSCVAGETVHLFVEYVDPLSQVLTQQKELEICSGLQNVLIALDFIHSKANVVHNNVCKDAIFVTRSGEWKLGYFDLSCSFSELNQGFLDQILSFRYDNAVPPEDEGKSKAISGESVSSRDLFAFGQLVKETLGKCGESPSLSDADAFIELASKQLQNANPQARGTASALSRHKFFDQPLLRAQVFLEQIAMKNAIEKNEFFKALPPLLFALPESVVGSRLVKLLLGRMVVLNVSAQQHLLPHLLIPRTDSTEGLFDLSNYRLYILPVVSRIFPVRDAQIRLMLLQYFPHYVGLMDREHLVQDILPELLLGIKDTDDVVVAATLRSLAELVPILGSSTVIGGKRLKLFTNGTPKCDLQPGKTLELTRRKSSDLKLIASNTTGLPERHEPDGGEDDADQGPMSAEADDHWSDWEGEEEEETNTDSLMTSLMLSSNPAGQSVPAAPSVPAAVYKKPLTDDLAALEIQVKAKDDEIDYFADMQPTITSLPTVYAVPTAADVDRLNFSVKQEEKEDDDGWNWED